MPENTIEVQVVNSDGFIPVTIYYDKLNLSIGSYPIAVPDANGFCFFKNVTAPYDLNMILAYYRCTYKGLSLKNPKIASFYEFGSYPKHLQVNVKFPPIENGKNGKIHFLSKDMFIQKSEGILHEGGSSIVLNMLMPENKTFISGKLAFIQYYNDAAGNTDYTNWGIKDVNLTTGVYTEVLFTAEDLIFDPPENDVSVNISYPNNPDVTIADVYLHFPGFNKNSDMLIDKITDCGEHVYKKVPESLNIPFNIEVTSYYVKFPEDLLFDLEKYKSIKLQPGSAGSIINRKVLLLTPQNEEERVTMNSYLSVKEEGEKGIYLFYVGGKIIITNSCSIKIGDIEFRGNRLQHNSFYSWEVIKFSSFNSIDEFAASPYFLQDNYNAIEYSDNWYFKTSP